ncbi:hypothetical protein ANANG_G00218270 [Anguilla anguilla]|uniref:Uncharacterized protein n=1 Tax=Anguilla anguilla TaxID=7936 RepID=A0A9D3LY16_ANGAN|nr:hypothetical protein ANANG_G00218270 [Anguilla anguilla]
MRTERCDAGRATSKDGADLPPAGNAPLASVLSQRSLQDKEGNPTAQVRESPHVSQADNVSGHGEEILQFTSPLVPVLHRSPRACHHATLMDHLRMHLWLMEPTRANPSFPLAVRR